MGSSRLPGKVLKPVLGRPLLELLVQRLRRSYQCGEICIATTTHPQDDVIEAFCRERLIDCFRGSEDDVLDRYHQVIGKLGVPRFVRITADCPLADPAVIDRVIEKTLEVDADVGTNIDPPTYPDGLDVYVITAKALEVAWKEARDAGEREHVTPFFWANRERFRIVNVAHDNDLSRSERWTLDYPEDLRFVQRVYEELYPANPGFGMRDVLRLEDRIPELRQWMSGLLPHNSFK